MHLISPIPNHKNGKITDSMMGLGRVAEEQLDADADQSFDSHRKHKNVLRDVHGVRPNDSTTITFQSLAHGRPNLLAFK